MPMLMGPFSVKPCQASESHRSSVQKRAFSSCPAVVLFTPKTTRAQPWSVLLHRCFLFINIPSLMNYFYSGKKKQVADPFISVSAAD